MSDLTLVIGNMNYSSWSLRPWIFMKRNNIPFEEKWISLFVDTTKAELSEYDSNSKVPVLIAKKQGETDLVIWDSLAIMEYLSETHLENAGWPADRRARATARSMSNEMHSSFAALRHAMPMNCRKTFHDIPLSKETSKDIERVKSLWRKCRKQYHSYGDWLFGDYSIADAMFAPVVLRFKGYGIELEDVEAEYAKTVLADKHIQDWITAGKAEKEVIEQDEANY